MHLKVLFSLHFPLHLKSLVFLHFSFIPRLARAESNYNTLNLQETQSSPKCSLGSPYMCSLALSCNNCCHPGVSSCVQVPFQHTASPPVTAKWIQDGVCLHVAFAFVPRNKGNVLSARMPCPTFPGSDPFCRKVFLQLLWRNRDGGIPTDFSRTSSFPLLKAEQSNHRPDLTGIYAKAPLISVRPWPSHPWIQVMTASAGRSSTAFVLSEENTVLSSTFTLSRKKVL